jgi:integrase
VRQPMTGKNLWRLCKTYGRLIGYPQLKPHDLRHGVAMEVYEQHGDLEQVRGLLGHARIDTTQVYAQIRPAQLKQSVAFYEGKALEALNEVNGTFNSVEVNGTFNSVFEELLKVPQTRS